MFQEKYIEYIPQERVVERVEYQAVERQVVHQPTQQVVQQPVQYVQQPVQVSRVVQYPTTYIQQAPITRTAGFGTIGAPLSHSYIAQPGVQGGFVQFQQVPQENKAAENKQ